MFEFDEIVTLHGFEQAMQELGYVCLSVNADDLRDPDILNYVWFFREHEAFGIDEDNAYTSVTLMRPYLSHWENKWENMGGASDVSLDEAYREFFEHILQEQRDIMVGERLVLRFEPEED